MMTPTEQTLDAIAKLETALGPVFTRIMRDHERATGRRRRKAHRLAMAVSEWRAAHARGEADVVWAVELDIAAKVFTHWSEHPIWEGEIRQSLSNPTDYPHALFTLVAAHELRAEPVMATGGKRLADLLVTSPGVPVYRAEVKCPLDLQAPIPDLGGDRARKVVQRCLSRAGSRTGGQMDASEPVMLVVGGFHLNPADVAAFVGGANRELNSVARPNIPGVMLLHWFCVVDGLEEQDGARRLAAGATVQGFLRKQWIRNPTHDGRVGIEVVPNGVAFEDLIEHRGSGPGTPW